MNTTSYSKDLIEKCKEIFKEEHGITLSTEDAMEALNNLSGLFLAFAKEKKQ